MACNHVFILLCTLAGAAPEVYAYICIMLGLNPDTGAAEPPHGKCTGFYFFLLNFFVQPGSPFRESIHNP